MNRIPEKVIVSLQDRGRSFSCDAELPSSMHGAALKQGLLRLLKEKLPSKYAGCTTLSIVVNNKELGNRETLADVAAWDGTILVLTVV